MVGKQRSVGGTEADAGIAASSCWVLALASGGRVGGQGEPGRWQGWWGVGQWRGGVGGWGVGELGMLDQS